MSVRGLTLVCLLSPLALAAQESEVPLAISLPTAERLQGWDMGVRFSHRFLQPARGASKDFYGLDGGNTAGLGLDLGIKPVPGLNAQIYRTSDGKTVVLALQQQLMAGAAFRLGVRVERFDETVQQVRLPLGTVGISGAAVQLPAELRLGAGVSLSLVPTWLSRTSLFERSLLNLGAGLRWAFGDRQALLAEYYPRPARLDPARYQPGAALAYRYKTRGHRFTLIATTVPGTTAHQLLGGDYGGGPRTINHWSFGFNLVRIF